MATQLTIVNNVLRRLREDTVTSVADNAYAQLMAMWVNDGIKDLADRYHWESLEHEVIIDLVVGQETYDLSKLVSAGGDVENTSLRVCNQDSMLLWDRQTSRPSAYLFTDTSDTVTDAWLNLISKEERIRKKNADRAQSNTYPTDFSLELNPEGDGYDLKVWPLPATTRTIRVHFWTPIAELAIDGTADATDIILSKTVIEAYVHMIASNERGEEMGEPGNVLERKYIGLLGAALESVMRAEEYTNRYESHRD